MELGLLGKPCQSRLNRSVLLSFLIFSLLICLKVIFCSERTSLFLCPIVREIPYIKNVLMVWILSLECKLKFIYFDVSPEDEARIV